MEYIISTVWDGKTRKLYPVTCQQCSKQFYAPKTRIAKRGAKFCSTSCSHVASRTQVESQCGFCGNKFTRRPSALKKAKSGINFCSRQCKDQGQSIKNGMTFLWPPHYSDGLYVDYRKIAFAIYDNKCNRCGYNQYPEILRVHHRDRNRKNSAQENLEILCPNCHEAEHFLAGDGLYTKHSKMVENTGNAPVCISACKADGHPMQPHSPENLG